MKDAARGLHFSFSSVALNAPLVYSCWLLIWRSTTTGQLPTASILQTIWTPLEYYRVWLPQVHCGGFPGTLQTISTRSLVDLRRASAGRSWSDPHRTPGADTAAATVAADVVKRPQNVRRNCSLMAQ